MRQFKGKSILIAGLTLLIATLLTGTVVWMRATKGPSGPALQALESDDRVRVSQTPGLIAFEPVSGGATTGFVFYPGAGVDFRSYAPLLGQVAARGYLAVLLEVPLNLAFLNMNAAEEAIQQYPDIENWAVGGHSLGGVVAAIHAASHPSTAALIFWASYPGNDALKDADFPILSIYGSRDGLSTPGQIEASRSKLPPDALFVEIQGGNHAQFGSYGSQAGDNPAAISAEDQWVQIVDATTALLEQAAR